MDHDDVHDDEENAGNPFANMFVEEEEDPAAAAAAGAAAASRAAT